MPNAAGAAQRVHVRRKLHSCAGVRLKGHMNVGGARLLLKSVTAFTVLPGDQACLSFTKLAGYITTLCFKMVRNDNPAGFS